MVSRVIAAIKAPRLSIYTGYYSCYLYTTTTGRRRWYDAPERVLQITDEDEIYPEDRAMVLNWGPLGWYDPRVESWSMGRLLVR